MAIIRTLKNKENPYVIINKSALIDKDLSLKAKGLFAYMMCLPNDWEVHVEELTNHFTDGVASVYSALKELKKAGFVKFERKKEAGRISRGEYTIFEEKQTSDSEILHIENLNEEILNEENQHLLNNNNTNKELLLNNNIYTPPVEIHPLQIHISQNLENVSKMKKQLTYSEAEKLVQDFQKEKIHKTLLQMENYKDLTKKNISVNLTLRNWIERNGQQSKSTHNKFNDKNRSITAGEIERSLQISEQFRRSNGTYTESGEQEMFNP